MTAVKPVLDAFLELNLVLALAAIVWIAARYVVSMTQMRHGFVAQLRALKILCLCVLLSPLLAIGAGLVMAMYSVEGGVAIGDLAVAAYLRGDIAMPATQFEALLNTRQRWIEQTLAGENPIISAILVVMALYSAVCILRIIRDGLAIRGIVRSSYLWRSSEKVDIRLSDRVTVPFAVRGLWRRHVVLPSHLLNTPSDMRFALAHELQHVRAADVEWELGFELLRPFLFWNPAYLILKFQFDRLRELACDQSVVSRREINAVEYTSCLLNYCSNSVMRGSPRVLNVALVKGGKAKRVLRQRVIALADAPAIQPTMPPLFFALSVAFAVILALGAASLQPVDDWSHDRLMLSTVVNLERLEARNQGN
ncbi:M56 family metallopeptidase [Ruegeria faecimaris]|uniref:M56 family metallopeptidase n=1 Tax=Ruegeria faecimaris TaxID=686389 RepID=UPI00248F6B84|nr:M56 family metallopeptidase [Ruegeria faecimaris]